MALNATTIEKDYTVAVADSPLFRLSGEVRNMIWRGVLHSDDGFGEGDEEDRSRDLQCALLFTCHIIQQETASIFYAENRVSVHCESYHPKAIMALTRRLELLHLPVQLIIEDNPYVLDIKYTKNNWPNLLLWLNMVHDGSIALPVDTGTLLDSEEDGPVVRLAVRALFGTAKDLQDIPWERAQVLLGKYRAFLIAEAKGWAKD